MMCIFLSSVSVSFKDGSWKWGRSANRSRVDYHDYTLNSVTIGQISPKFETPSCLFKFLAGEFKEIFPQFCLNH